MDILTLAEKIVGWESIPNGNSFNGLINYFILSYKAKVYEVLCSEREKPSKNVRLDIRMSSLTTYYEGNKEFMHSESIIDTPISLREAIHVISSQKIMARSEKIVNGNDNSTTPSNEKMPTISKLLLLKPHEMRGIDFGFETINGFSKVFWKKSLRT
ncbi:MULTISPECIES: hypothetical protein [Symbiopectobacterium]|uniref:hypothetical protein n=1 Tax=Symbiopectobacterium TaxID=801 RepID=UPI001A2F200D|nr:MULTISPECIES: hypothetical protein [Symbiopectobacterium]MBG6248940.1 hypothetical protein [Candidatus Symbiopectobacterium sp. PLON1]MBT9429042.1 hypothetical protein [Candidatus Symbiopectobacterium endolongispinus]